MFIGSIITNSSSIIKFLKESRFAIYFTKPQLHIIALIMSAMIKKGFVGKVTDVADLMPFRHRTNIGKFLSKSPWNEDFIERALRNLVIKKVFNASKKAGFKYVGGLRTNRVIYPTNHERLGIKLNAFGKTLTKEDVDLVKVGNSEYYVYSYKGKLNDLKEALIVLSWPKEALFKDGCLRAFISPDSNMSLLELLNHYKHRWPMEIFFRESKKKLGLDDYQIRSEKSIKRYLLIMMIIYVYCGLEVSEDTLKFSNGLKTARAQLEAEKITFIYEKTQAGEPLDAILELFNAA